MNFLKLKKIMLWITFKICIFVIANNNSIISPTSSRAVNYFQNLYLCDFQQLFVLIGFLFLGCELLSKFVSLWFETILWVHQRRAWKLWITFKICIFVIANNYSFRCTGRGTAVNYFQNLYLCDFQQLLIWLDIYLVCCELLSKFVSLWLPTTTIRELQSEISLWITFKICIFVIANNFILRFTPLDVLWITFKICIFVTSNNAEYTLTIFSRVVNYFQNLYLCDFQQRRKPYPFGYGSCELLSKFVSLWLPTTIKRINH